MNEKKMLCFLLLFTGLNYAKSSSLPQFKNPKELFDAFWNWRISDMPEFATSVGVHTYDDQLDDLSEAAYLARFEKCHEFLAAANELEPSLTDETDIINLKVLKYELETYINNFDLKGFYLPINNLEGPQIDMELQFGWMSLDTYNDYDVMMRRLEKLPLYIDHMIDLMRAGVKNNITYHEISMKNLNRSIGRFVVENPTESPFYDYFRGDFPETLTKKEIADIQMRTQSIISQDVTPAYKKLLNYISNEYKTRKSISITSIHRGEEFYNSLIRFHTSTNYTAKEIQDIGFIEIGKIEQEMIKIINEMGLEGMNIYEFSNLIRNDLDNYYNNSDDLIARFKYIVDDVIDPRLPRIFSHIPKEKLRVLADPVPYITGAYYVPGSYDGSRSGVFYVNTYYSHSLPKYAMLYLALHEGNPGHHFELSHRIESNSPNFKKVTQDLNYGISPSRFPLYTFYVEGWALYAESLSFDLKLCEDSLERYGYYAEESYRTSRLVVDTGMHALGWSRKEAIDYMLVHTAAPLVVVENEIDRYITWPGQGLAYKLGEMKIEQFRKEAEEKLGPLFDIKEFHESVLNSFGPISIMEEVIHNWIDRKLSGEKKEAK